MILTPSPMLLEIHNEEKGGPGDRFSLNFLK